MKIWMGCSDLPDDTFVEAFESCRLRNDLFHHADHVRLTWIYVCRFSESVAVERVMGGIRRFATHNGSPQKFHYTQTCAWVRLIAAAHGEPAGVKTFEEFIEAHSELLGANALSRYYSMSVLHSPAARAGWIEPDISPLPSVRK